MFKPTIVVALLVVGLASSASAGSRPRFSPKQRRVLAAGLVQQHRQQQDELASARATAKADRLRKRAELTTKIVELESTRRALMSHPRPMTPTERVLAADIRLRQMQGLAAANLARDTRPLGESIRAALGKLRRLVGG